MKIKKYIDFIKEDLNDDFNKYIEDNPCIGANNSNLNSVIVNLVETLPLDIAGEFKYRLSDGEDVSKLIKEILVKANNKKTTFIGNIILNALKEPLSEDDVKKIRTTEQIIRHYEMNKNNLIEEFSNLNDYEELENVLKYSIDYYNEEDDNFNRTFSSKRRMNSFKIKTINNILKLIEEIKSKKGF